MLRTTRSTPTPPPSEDATAPVPAALAVRFPNSNPDRAAATLVDSATTLEDLPCFIPGALGAGMVLDLERVSWQRAAAVLPVHVSKFRAP